MTLEDPQTLLAEAGADRRALGERLRAEREPTPASVRAERDPLDAKLLGERALATTAAEWLEELQDQARKKPGLIVRQETIVGTIRVAYYRGQGARYSDGRYAGDFFAYERRLPNGMWDFARHKDALALLAQAIERGA